MLDTFANYLRIAQGMFGGGLSMQNGILEPAKLAEVLVSSFLEDVWGALTSSVYTCVPVELRSVGTLQRVKGGKIVFSPDPHLGYEAGIKQSFFEVSRREDPFLLDGKFWRVLCRVDTEEEIFFIPPRHPGTYIHSTARLREVADCMFRVIQRNDHLLNRVLLKTLHTGLCLAIHDAICASTGFYLERIGRFYNACHFEVDPILREYIRIRNSGEEKIYEERKCWRLCESFFLASRRTNFNRHWWRSDDA